MKSECKNCFYRKKEVCDTKDCLLGILPKEESKDTTVSLSSSAFNMDVVDWEDVDIVIIDGIEFVRKNSNE